MPTYDYVCTDLDCTYADPGITITHSIAACDRSHWCLNNHRMHRVIRKAPEAFFFGPDFASNSGVAKANVGRNPTNQNRYSE